MKTIGIIGGGQLGRMLIQANKHHIKFHVYSDTEEFPSKEFCHSYTIGDLNDYEKIVAFGNECDVVTIEIENVNIDALRATSAKVYPFPDLLDIVKDKYKQKRFFSIHDIPTLNYILYNGEEISFPCVNKLCKGGYDGRGVRIIKSKYDELFKEPSIIEDYCNFDRELSVIVAQNIHGEIYIFPPTEMVFNKENMLDYLICPTDISPNIAEKIYEIAKKIAKKTHLVGLLAIELFQKGSSIYVNEIAPRPHNSGHHTQDMFDHSQFDILMGCLLDMSMPANRQIAKYGACVNMLGSVCGEGPPKYNNLDEISQSSKIYMYGKKVTKPYRKMGHVNIIADTIDELQDKIKRVKSLIDITPQIIVAVIMGSISDMPVMEGVLNILKEFNVPFEVKIVSAHRTPEYMIQYGKEAQSRGLKVIIAGAGGAAHLPGMIASVTSLPVIGIPIKSSNSIDGWDSVLSILQMPGGVPVATMALNGAKNAGLFAVRILGMNKETDNYRKKMEESVREMNKNI